MGPVKCGTMPTKWVSQRAAILSISVMPPTLGSVARQKSMCVIFDERVEVPAIAPLFAGGQGDVDLLAEDGQVLKEGLGADGVFDEEGGEVLNHVAAADGVGEIEALVEVDGPVAVFADTFAHGGAHIAHGGDALAGVVGGVDGHGECIEAEEHDSRPRW